MAQNIICSPWGRTKGPWLCLMPKYYLVLLDYFPSSLHFLTSLITFSLTKVFLQRIGGRPGWGSILEGLIELNELKNAQVLGELKALLNVVVNSFCCKWQFTELPSFHRSRYLKAMIVPWSCPTTMYQSSVTKQGHMEFSILKFEFGAKRRPVWPCWSSVRRLET